MQQLVCHDPQPNADSQPTSSTDKPCAIQVLRYQKDQKYGAHYDSLNRVCTTLVFLTDTDAGGETAFPKTTDAHWADATQKAAATADGPFSACAEGHVAVKPRKGDALLFYSMHPNGVDTDPMAMHTGCPITEEWSRKWTATFWIHGKVRRCALVCVATGSLAQRQPAQALCHLDPVCFGAALE